MHPRSGQMLQLVAVGGALGVERASPRTSGLLPGQMVKAHRSSQNPGATESLRACCPSAQPLIGTGQSVPLSLPRGPVAWLQNLEGRQAQDFPEVWTTQA